MRNINEAHLRNALKILEKEKYKYEELSRKDPRKYKKKVDEIDYCICFIEALYGGYEGAMKQGRLF